MADLGLCVSKVWFTPFLALCVPCLTVIFALHNKNISSDV